MESHPSSIHNELGILKELSFESNFNSPFEILFYSISIKNLYFTHYSMTDFNLPSIFVPLVGLKRRGQIFSMYFQDHNTDIFFSFYTQMKNKVNAISESKKVNYLGKNMISAVGIVCIFLFTPREIEQKAAELAYFLRYQ
ncbi:hypothetical protein ACJX0J_001790, partial [Zea mays]